METAAILVLSIGLIAASATSVALAVRQAGLREKLSALGFELNSTAKELMETASEFSGFKSRATKQLEALRDEINDLEDNLDACTDPVVLRDHLGRLLSKAAGRDSDTSSDVVSRDDWG